jgi:hypothetical protein
MPHLHRPKDLNEFNTLCANHDHPHSHVLVTELASWPAFPGQKDRPCKCVVGEKKIMSEQYEREMS